MEHFGEDAAIHRPEPIHRRKVLYPNLYVWFVLLSVLDVLLTAQALTHGAYEANIFAAWFLKQYGMIGLVGVKFTAVPFVIFMCEYIGRRKPPTGRRLIEWVVALASVPVVTTMIMLLIKIYA